MPDAGTVLDATSPGDANPPIDATADVPSVQALYGAPVPVDAADESVRITPAYGAPVISDR
jgi:hypothetical protein